MHVGEPYVQQDAHQRFLIDARLFLGKNFPSPPLLQLEPHANCAAADRQRGTPLFTPLLGLPSGPPPPLVVVRLFNWALSEKIIGWVVTNRRTETDAETE